MYTSVAWDFQYMQSLDASHSGPLSMYLSTLAIARAISFELSPGAAIAIAEQKQRVSSVNIYLFIFLLIINISTFLQVHFVPFSLFPYFEVFSLAQFASPLFLRRNAYHLTYLSSHMDPPLGL